MLGSGLGRDSQIATQGERKEGSGWLAYEERSFEAFRSYFEVLPRGRHVIEYSVRLNNPGRFQLPPTRVEAMSRTFRVTCRSHAAVLFAGSESGGVYKSVDSGNSWSMVTHDLLVFDVKCVKIHPSNENVVLFGSAGKIYKTTDGGITWVITGDANFQSQNIYTWDLYFNPADPNIVYAGTNYGLYRSTDEGDNWTQIFPGQCMSVMVKPDDASVIYALQYDAATKIPYFYKSIDSGATFTEKPQGWFEVPAVDLGKIESDGGRAMYRIMGNRVCSRCSEQKLMRH